MASRSSSWVNPWYYIFLPFPLWGCMYAPERRGFARFIALFLYLIMWLSIGVSINRCLVNSTCQGTGDTWFIALTCYCFALFVQFDTASTDTSLRRPRSTYKVVQQQDNDEDDASLLLGSIDRDANAQNSVIAKARRKSKKDFALIQTFAMTQLQDKIKELTVDIEKTKKKDTLNEDERRVLVMLLQRNLAAARKRLDYLSKSSERRARTFDNFTSEV